MNWFDKFALAAAVIITWLCAGMTRDAIEIYIILEQLGWTMTVIGVAGWIIATYGPIGIAPLFWRWAKRVRAPWLLHLLFLPCAIAASWAGQELMLSVMGPAGFDHTLGAPVLPGLFLFLIAVGGYAAALISKLFARSSEKAEPG